MKKYNISILENNKDTRPQQLSLTFDELINYFDDYYRSTIDKNIQKDSAKAIIAGHFRDGGRVTENLISRTMLILDIDKFDGTLDKLTDFVFDELAAFTFYSYDTFSSTSEMGRIRVILPLRSEVPTQDFGKLARAFTKTLSLDFQKILDGCTYTANAMMYMSFDNGTEGMTSHNKNELLNLNYYETDEVETTKTNSLTTSNSNKSLMLSGDEIDNYLNAYPAENLSYAQWLEVGIALHAEYEGSDEGLELFTNWSLLDKRYNDQVRECAEKYKSFKANGTLSFATIIKRIKDLQPKKSVDYKTSPTEIIQPSVYRVPSHLWVHYDEIIKKNKDGTTDITYKPIATYENFCVMLDYYKIKLHYDVINIKVKAFKDGKDWKDNNLTGQQDVDVNTNFIGNTLDSLTRLNKIHVNSLEKYIANVAYSNQINSWLDFVKSKPWDGVSRFNEFAETIKVKEEYRTIRNIYLKKWMLQMIHVTCLNYGKPKQARNVLIFQSEQRMGKTTWFTRLVPHEYKEDFLLEGFTLNVSDEMSKVIANQYVFVELGEMAATFRKSDTEMLKNFLSSTCDGINRKYVAEPQRYKRRTVFFGTVNDHTFLSDATGNTRFLILPILQCDIFHTIDMQQLYAELYEEAKTVDNYELNDDEMSRQTEINNEFTISCTIEERFVNIFDTKSEERESSLTVSECLEKLGYNVSEITSKRQPKIDMVSVFKKLGYKKNTNTNKYRLPKLKHTTTDVL